MRLVMLTIAGLVALVGCSRASAPQNPDVARVEEFAGLDVPTSASDVRVFFDDGALDSELGASFTIARADLAPFLAGTGNQGEFTPGLRAIYTEPDRSLGWDLDTVDNATVLGLRDRSGERFREIMVDMADPERPKVYVRAGTV